MRAPKGRRSGKRLADDVELREQLAYVVPAGIPHSVFLGRSVGPGEPLWLPDDADKAIAYRRWEAAICGMCGTKHADWFDADGQPLDPPPYQPVAHRCPGSAETARLNRHLTESKADMDGAFVALEPFDPFRRPFDAPPEGDE